MANRIGLGRVTRIVIISGEIGSVCAFDVLAWLLYCHIVGNHLGKSTSLEMPWHTMNTDRITSTRHPTDSGENDGCYRIPNDSIAGSVRCTTHTKSHLEWKCNFQLLVRPLSLCLTLARGSTLTSSRMINVDKLPDGNRSPSIAISTRKSKGRICCSRSQCFCFNMEY